MAGGDQNADGDLRWELVRRVCESETGLSFAEFMELALYHPRWGYYSGPRRIGRGGDFYTAVSVGRCLGVLLARQARQTWEDLGRPPGFRIVEQGAHDGQLAKDLLEEWPEADYWIVEPREAFRAVQTERLGERVRQVTGVVQAGGGPCFFLANELLDAFPVERYRFGRDGWEELRVGFERGNFVDWAKPVPRAEWEALALPASAPEGFVTEFCPGLRSWMEALSEAMLVGRALLLDYGVLPEERFALERAGGSVRGYRDHRRTESIYESPGEIDLTAHVDFGRVALEAERAGFSKVEIHDQGPYLARLAKPWLLEMERENRVDLALVRQFQTLTHPGLMGRAFRVVVLEKGLMEECLGPAKGGA